ncbi:MAG: LysR family transcriptional regulator [Clostridiales bacterium]|nr:LysR family transcriptional regulator [Clostridiales bacterium]
MSINLEWYKVFYHVVQTGSFSKAAKTLYVSQSAISQTIKQLEHELNQQLLIRLPRGIKLSPSGEVLFSHIEPAFNLILSGEKQLSLLLNLQKGSITISASDTICMYYLPTYIKKFISTYPNINISISNKTTDETIELLKKGIVEIGLINSRDKLDSKIKLVKEDPLEEGFFVSKQSSINLQTNYSFTEISKLPLMLLEKGTSTRDHIDKVFANSDIVLQPIMELGSVDLLIRYAILQMGVICVSKEFVEQSPYYNQLAQLKIKKIIPKRAIGIVIANNVPLSKASKAFLELIADYKV